MHSKKNRDIKPMQRHLTITISDLGYECGFSDLCRSTCPPDRSQNVVDLFPWGDQYKETYGSKQKLVHCLWCSLLISNVCKQCIPFWDHMSYIATQWGLTDFWRIQLAAAESLARPQFLLAAAGWFMWHLQRHKCVKCAQDKYVTYLAVCSKITKINTSVFNKKLSCYRQTGWWFVSTNILLSHSRSFKMTALSTACASSY